jgi:hypothetical protein
MAMNADRLVAPRIKPLLAMECFRRSIADIVRGFGCAVCASCLTQLTAEEYRADNVDVRVTVVHLALGDDFRFGITCGWCGTSDAHRNPIIRVQSD